MASVIEEQETLGAPLAPGATADERLLADLNPAQREAVTHGEGPLLVVAGAGSGKTRVLTHRVAHLVATGMARPSEILAITFTNKAANEMRERVEALVGGVSRLMWVMTFHSACARILRAEAERLAYKRSFTIYDESDSLRMAKRCMEELEVDPKRFPPRAVRSQISAAKNRLLDAESLAEEQSSFFEETVADVYRLYEKRMHTANAMDFDDLLVRTVNLFELFSDVRERYQRAFRWVLVDEYQDTNRAQYRLLQLLCEQHGNLCVVGDEDQSIYSFRSAEIRNILDFERDFGGASVYKLEQNYRSTETILEAANAIVSNNRDRREKHLWSDAGRGEAVTIAELDDEHEEARYVAGELERLCSEEGLRRSQIAVFYRTNAQSRVLEDTLVRFEVPYQVIGGTKFYERAEIKDAVAYLSLLANPADAVSFARVVNSPRRGIGQRTQQRLLSHANTTGATIWEAIQRPEDVPGLGAGAVKAVGRFAETMSSLGERAAGSAVGDLLDAVLAESGYIEALEAERTIEAEGRVENLQELVGVAREFDADGTGSSMAASSVAHVQSTQRSLRPGPARSGARQAEEEEAVPPLEEFLQQISLYTEQDGLHDDEDLATLMTLHNAKGLEFDAVFMIGCEEGVFPHSRSMDEGNLEEERRLCYVGVTRSRRRLYMTSARRRRLYGNAEFGLPSRFLKEIPEELTERYESERRAPTGWSLGRAPAAPAAPPRPQPRSPAVELGLGDDVVHASFGEGVVTAVEPGQVVVVRFASDGTEKKLMAEYAPLRKAS